MVNTVLAAIFIVGFCLMGGLCAVWYEVRKVERILKELVASQEVGNDLMGMGFIALHKELKGVSNENRKES